MDTDLSELELGIVASLQTLREALKRLSIGGKRWWIASDPLDAVEDGYLTIGYGDPKCFDRLNTLHFRIPVIGNDSPPERTDRIVLLIEPTTATGEEPAFYLENRSMPEDPVEDFYDFYAPLERALIARLQARN
jgi:hypothetical protein